MVRVRFYCDIWNAPVPLVRGFTPSLMASTTPNDPRHLTNTRRVAFDVDLPDHFFREAEDMGQQVGPAIEVPMPFPGGE